MYPYNNQFRDLRSLHNLHATMGRQPLIHGPGLWSLRGRSPYPRILRRPSENGGRLRQMPMRNFPGPFKQPSNFGTDNSNVSTHSTVRWLNNSIKSFKPTNTRLYSNSANLIPVPNQSQASVTKLAQTSDSSQSSNVAKSETQALKTKSTPISDSNQSSDLAKNETRIPNVPSTESKSSKVDNCTETDTPDGPGGISDLVSISIPPWLKSGNESTMNELNPVEKISTITNPDTSSIQDTETRPDDSIMEGIEQLSNETTESKVASWSSVLEELQSSKESEEKRAFKGRGRGIASKKTQKRRRYRDFRKLQRGIKRFSIGEFTGATTSSNIYTDYIVNLRRGGNFATSTAHGSFSAPQPVPHFYGNRMNQWNMQPSPIMLMPRTFNPSPRPRFPFIGERPVFGAHRWSGTAPYYVRNRRPIGQDSASWMTDASNRPATS